MLIRNCFFWPAGVVISLLLLAAIRPLAAETPSDAERLQKLEQAVSQLQKRNAELEQEVSGLKKRTSWAPVVGAEGKTKTEVTSDGKTYVEKLVPELHGGEKWKLFPAITELELFGDLRLRYEYRGGRLPDHFQFGQDNANDWQERERERYRLRIGLRGTVLDDWFFGVRLETGAGPRSTNVTFGADTSTTSPGGGGPFAKGDDGVFVGQAYGGYKGFPGFTFTGGKMPNPFVYTRMVWDDDINPEGLAEQWKHTFTIGGGAAEPVSYSKDGKNVAPPPPAEPLVKIDVFANFGQFVYDDSNPSNPIGAPPTQTQPIGGETQEIPLANAFLLGWQVGAKFDFPHILYFQLAPTLYNYTGNGDTFNIHYQGGSPFVTNAASLAQNQTGINSLLVFDMPWEIGWKVGELPMQIFGDFSANLEADDRATAAGHPGFGDERYAYQVGAGVGQLKQKHDWQIDIAYQHSEQYALDPNLVDDDIFDGRQNMHGIIVRAGYALSDAVIFNVTWNYGWRINDNLGTGGTPIAIGINPVDQYQFFVADLNIKF
ncbi:MAG TPA: putative porin [Verrucomicrobiae bacterium]|nr:putative porin [Verrucomicrobiae bacterium]